MDKQNRPKLYDQFMPLICKPYLEFLSLGASVIPEDVRRVRDLGIGTGSFSLAVQSRNPKIQIYGIDRDFDSLQTAQTKIPRLIVYNGDIFDKPLKGVDYHISSLATHHFREKVLLKKIVEHSRGFVNFDIFLSEDYTKQKIIEEIISFAETNGISSEILNSIEKEMYQNDFPRDLDIDKELFESLGLKFKVLANEGPYWVYHTYKPN